MPDDLDVNAMISRFRERAAAVKRRGIPPVEGPERLQIIRQMQLDFQDFAMIGDTTGTLEDGILTLRLDLRPPAGSADPATGGPDSADPTTGGPDSADPATGGPGNPNPADPPAATGQHGRPPAP